MRFSMTLLRALALLPILSIPAFAKPLKITEVTASSTYPEEKGRTYEPKNVKDQKLSTSWFEGVDGGGLGSSIELTLEGTQSVSAVRIWNGDWITADLWKRENRMQDIEIETSDGTKYPFKLKDEMAMETLTFPSAVTTSSIKIRYKTIYRGSTFNDTGISEIRCSTTHRRRRCRCPPTRHRARTRRTPTATTVPKPRRRHDRLALVREREDRRHGRVGAVHVQLVAHVAGHVDPERQHVELPLFMSGSHATGVTLTFSDGTTQQIPLKSSINNQLVPLGGKSTSSVKVAVTGVSKGQDTSNSDPLLQRDQLRRVTPGFAAARLSRSVGPGTRSPGPP